jgi:hypothetical protein
VNPSALTSESGTNRELARQSRADRDGLDVGSRDVEVQSEAAMKVRRQVVIEGENGRAGEIEEV